MAFLPSRVTRNLGLVMGYGAGIAGVSAGNAKADVIVPTLAGILGQHRSSWRSHLKLCNPYTQWVAKLRRIGNQRPSCASLG
jgi:hypothetical protein